MAFVAPILMGVSSIFGAVSSMKASKQQSQPAALPPPAAPTEAGASAKAQAEVDKRRRISLLSGGETNLTNGMGAASSSDVGKKSLLGA